MPRHYCVPERPAIAVRSASGEMFTRDWSARFVYQLRRDIEDYVCGEKHGPVQQGHPAAGRPRGE
jgi:hypothetical protein